MGTQVGIDNITELINDLSEDYKDTRKTRQELKDILLFRLRDHNKKDYMDDDDLSSLNTLVRTTSVVLNDLDNSKAKEVGLHLKKKESENTEALAAIITNALDQISQKDMEASMRRGSNAIVINEDEEKMLQSKLDQAGADGGVVILDSELGDDPTKVDEEKSLS